MGVETEQELEISHEDVVVRVFVLSAEDFLSVGPYESPGLSDNY